MDICPTCKQQIKEKKRFQRPAPIEVTEYAKEIGFKLDGQQFCNYYESKGWVVGKSPMKSWKAAVRTWKGQATPDKLFSQGSSLEDKQAKMAAREKELKEMAERHYLRRTGQI